MSDTTPLIHLREAAEPAFDLRLGFGRIQSCSAVEFLVTRFMNEGDPKRVPILTCAVGPVEA